MKYLVLSIFLIVLGSCVLSKKEIENCQNDCKYLGSTVEAMTDTKCICTNDTILLLRNN